jgi:hypothetical protein
VDDQLRIGRERPGLIDARGRVMRQGGYGTCTEQDQSASGQAVDGFHVRSVLADDASVAPAGTLEWVCVLTRTGREAGVVYVKFRAVS